MVKLDPIVIPELEEAARNYVPKQRPWTEKEIATIRQYYGRVPTTKLAGYLKRSVTGIQQIATRIGATHRKKEADND